MRSEAFGLLFYDTRSTNLTFVRSGGRLVPQATTASGERELAVSEPEAQVSGAVARVLQTLETKGLVRAVGRTE